MAITSSAKKALRSAKKKRVFNLRRKADIEKNIKAFRKLVLAKDKAAATKMIPIVYQVLRQGGQDRLHKAERRVSQQVSRHGGLSKIEIVNRKYKKYGAFLFPIFYLIFTLNTPSSFNG